MKNKTATFDSSRRWFEVRNATAASADVFLYDEIGMWGITASDVIKMLNELKVPKLNVHINSPGGSVFDGFAIYNALNAHPASIVVHIDGIAASIASVIAMAGDEIRMAENSMMMIHNPWVAVVGQAKDLRSSADILDKLRENIVATYAARTGMKPEGIAAAMDGESWFSAAECKANGFCSEVIEAKKMAAHFDLSAFKNAPTTFSAPAENNEAPLQLSLQRLKLLESEYLTT
jgi:ATP-dependent Clp protease protease subunit